jgi:uncharacterized membrane protein
MTSNPNNESQTGGRPNGHPVGDATAASPQKTSGVPNYQNVPAAAAYILGAISAFLMLLLPQYKHDPEVRFHAFQAIFAHGALLVIASIVGIAGGELAGLARQLVGLASVALWGFLLYKTYQGEKIVLPIVGSMAERQSTCEPRT